MDVHIKLIEHLIENKQTNSKKGQALHEMSTKWNNHLQSGLIPQRLETLPVGM